MAVLATGGTIATRTDESGTAIARASGQELVGDLSLPPGVAVEAEDVVRVGSFALTLEDLQQLADRVGKRLEDDVAGIVVTHGTDTTEETAMLLDLVIDDPRPIVLTGAQRPADAPDSDGPRNLADAIAVAAHPAARGLGTRVVFDGTVLPARGVAKTRTVALSRLPGRHRPARLGAERFGARRSRPPPASRTAAELRGPAPGAVDIVASCTRADATVLHAFAAAGAGDRPAGATFDEIADDYAARFPREGEGR